MKVYTEGKVVIKSWCNNPDENTIEQALDVANHPATFHHVTLMPDTHLGYGLPIGGVVAFDKVISPFCIGSDIACGMMACKTNIKVESLGVETLQKIINQIKRDVPMGHSHHSFNKNNEKFIERFKDIWKLYKSTNVRLSKILNLKFPDCAEDACKNWERVAMKPIVQQCGTLGGGNHFLELQKDEDNYLWIMIHSGSRNIGKRVCDYYHDIAKNLCQKWHSELPSDRLAFLPVNTNEGQAYIKCMNFCMEFSYLNREYMLKSIKYAIERYIKTDITYDKPINIHHNFARLENHFGKNVWVHRKGATSARKNEIGLIPGSMGTKSYVVKGKGNPNSFTSCSHGAGRCMGRKQAERDFNIDEFKSKMQGIISNDVNVGHLDESPMAYKDINIVMKEQQDLVEIVHELTPIANIKG